MTSLLLLILLPNITLLIQYLSASLGKNIFADALTPYTSLHGSHLTYREIRDCHKKEYESLPHELVKAYDSINISEPFIQIKRFVKNIQPTNRMIRGHYIIISDPLKTLSVLEADQAGGCNLTIKQTVSETSKKGNCILALNAGFFDTKRGICYGNVISDGRKARDSKGIQNAHFGLTEDGQIFTGYLSEEEFYNGNFRQLVGGVIWIVRNGTGFVNASKMLECDDVQETGSMEQFISILSARSVVGHDKDGKIVFVQVDGKSGVDGINLYEMENLLRDFGIINAVNLDGGGSSTLVVDGVTVNYPYDQCPDGSFSCERRVSTVMCVHSPYCEPKDCNNHGTCSMGKCICDKNWMAPHCNELFCGQNNCSGHGVCLPEGCICYPGFYGENCDKICTDGWFGSMCTQQCNCINADSCDRISGNCSCRPGYTGHKCEDVCPKGLFGFNCQSKCLCEDDCYCDHVTGSCDVPQNSSFYYAAKCLAKDIIQKQHLVKENPDEKRKWETTIIILGIITTLCLTSFILILFCSCSCRCHNEQVLCSKNRRRKFTKIPLHLPSGELSDSLSDSEIYPMKSMPKR